MTETEPVPSKPAVAVKVAVYTSGLAVAVRPLTAAGLTNLYNLLPEGERYTYNFEGNSQALDHMFVSNNLLNKGGLTFDVVHANSEFFDQVADHADHLVELGVTYLHLMPLLTPRPAPNDGGYAVADYRYARQQRSDVFVGHSAKGSEMLSQWLVAQLACSKRAEGFMGKFGMDPASRSRVMVDPQADLFGSSAAAR